MLPALSFRVVLKYQARHLKSIFHQYIYKMYQQDFEQFLYLVSEHYSPQQGTPINNYGIWWWL